MAEKHNLVIYSMLKLNKLISFERLKMIDRHSSGSHSENNEEEASSDQENSDRNVPMSGIKNILIKNLNTMEEEAKSDFSAEVRKINQTEQSIHQMVDLVDTLFDNI